MSARPYFELSRAHQGRRKKLMLRRLLALVISWVGANAVSSQSQAAMRPVALTCEYKTNPLGLGEIRPRLSWKLESDQRGERQTAYQILVASTRANLRNDKGDLWDSGKVTSDQSIQVVYQGRPLASRMRAFWKVRVWDRAGQETTSDQPARWEMGLLAPTDWKAQWIGHAVKSGTVETYSDVKWIWFPEGDPRSSAPKATRYFRTAFDVPADRPIKQSELLIAADNTYDANVNNVAVGSGGDWHVFQSHNILPQLTVGRNVLAIAAGNEDGPAGLAALVKITYGDGTVQRIATGPGWKTATDPQDGWKTTDFDATNWKEAAILASIGDAPWIMPRNSVSPPSTYLRKTFQAAESIRQARIYVTARGLYFLSINGHRVSKDIFTPGWTDYRKRIQYQTYDVTRQLRSGENAIGVVLGDGWYCGNIAWAGRQNYGPYAMGLVQLEVTYRDGTQKIISSDASWKASEGPIRASDLLMGEVYDAEREMPGWNAPGFDDSKWMTADVESIGDVPLVAPPGPQVAKVVELHPKSISQKPSGSYIFDLKQNMVGWARLRVRGKAGTVIRLRFAEMLNPDGSMYTTNLRGAKATDTYTLKGNGEEIYEPSFTFHGFRYVEVTGYPGVPDKRAITGIVVHSATPPTGTFSCSRPLVNQLAHNIIWGQMGNYLEAPTDCPQRDERLGWMGDAQIFVRTACYNMDIAGFMTKWVQDVVDAQSPEGGFADVSPRVGDPADGAPAWGDAGVIVPWTIYEHYADTRLLTEHYEAMAKWIEYIHVANPDLLWSHRANNNFGDWLNIREETPHEVLATAYFAYSTHLMAKIAHILGKSDDAARYEALFQGIKTAFNKAYVEENGRIKGDTQTAYVLALHFDLLPAEKRSLAARYLVEDIMDKSAGHLATGFVGVGYLTPTLTSVGHLDVAYKLLNNDTFPSWGYSIRQGATTIWERWDGWTKEKGFQDPGMNSFNHYSLGSVGQWLYQSVGGIDLDPDQPGFKHILMHPQPGGGLTFAKASYDSIYGKIVSDWNVNGSAFQWHITVPANTTATVYVPAKNPVAVEEGNTLASQAEGVHFLRMENGCALFEVGSGDYNFTSDR